MDPNKKTFSFPAADQYREQAIPGAIDSSIPKQDDEFPKPRRTVNIIDALADSKKDNGDAQTVRTYQSDIADTIKNDNVSMIKVALSEKKRQERRGSLDNTLEESHKNLYLVIGAVFAFLVIAGLIGGFIFLQAESAKKEATEEQQKVQPILYTETISLLNIDQINIDDLTKLIEKDKEAVMELGDMKSIILTTGTSTAERQLTTAEFFQVLNSRAPDGLIRSLDPNYLLGVYAFTPRDMFAVFHVSSYDSAFAGMFEWEPNIESDIGDIFINKKERVDRDINTLSQMNAILATSTSTSTSGTNVNTATSTKVGTTTAQSSPFGVFSQRRFIDKVLSNKDARVLVDVNGKEAMIYTFLDKETLVIATSEKSLKEIIFRLTTGRIVR